MSVVGKILGLISHAELISRPISHFGMSLENHYLVECFGEDGTPKWSDEFDNLVVDVGLTDSLDKHMKGIGYTASWALGLTDAAPSVAANNTMSVHPGWNEIVAYTEGTRPIIQFGTASNKSIDNVANKAVFSVSSSVVVGGCFVCTGTGKGSSSGLLYGVGPFQNGDRAVNAGDTLNVTIICTAS